MQTIFYSIYKFITFNLQNPLINVFGKITREEEGSRYMATVLSRLVVYPTIAIILFSLLGVKSKIDRLFKWAQR